MAGLKGQGNCTRLFAHMATTGQKLVSLDLRLSARILGRVKTKWCVEPDKVPGAFQDLETKDFLPP